MECKICSILENHMPVQMNFQERILAIIHNKFLYRWESRCLLSPFFCFRIDFNVDGYRKFTICFLSSPKK